MKTDLDPKQVFQRHTEIKDELLRVTQSGNFQFSLSFALAEFANRNPTVDELRGVRVFIDILLNLPQNEQPQEPIPMRRLHQAAYTPISPPQNH